MKKKILITGGAGFIGSYLADYYYKKKYKIYIIDNLSTGFKSNLNKKFIFIKKSCEDKTLIKDLKGIDFNVIYHLAGQSSGEYSFYKPFEDFSSNLAGTLNIVNICLKTKSKRLIFASSMSVYGNSLKAVSEKDKCTPRSFYGLSKLSAENYLIFFSKKGLNYSILRFFNVYGPGQNFDNKLQGMVSIYLEQALKNKNIIIKGSKSRYRDFIYIDDVIEIISKVTSNKNSINQIFNVGVGKKTKVSELIELIKQQLRLQKKNIKYLKQGTPDDTHGIYSNNNKIKKILNKNKFVNLNDGLKKTLKNELIKLSAD